MANEMAKHTPGPWRWLPSGWKAADECGSVHYQDGENPAIEKYMDLQLVGPDKQDVIPLRIDHYETIYDGDPITPADRALIAAAPELLAALQNLENDDGERMPASAWKMVQDAIAKATVSE